jgi:hypothetical protein
MKLKNSLTCASSWFYIPGPSLYFYAASISKHLSTFVTSVLPPFSVSSRPKGHKFDGTRKSELIKIV